MVSFWHPDGSNRDESGFPSVEFWHPDRKSARKEAARVLIVLREERGDERDWVAAGHPDPFEVGAGRHPGGQWTLRYRDLRCDGKGLERSTDKTFKPTKSAAGSWRGNVDGEALKQMLYEARRTVSSTEIEQ